MNWYRVFFKKYEIPVSGKSSASIEIREKSFDTACVKAKKMGKKKHMRVVMVAEVTKPSGMSDHL